MRPNRTREKLATGQVAVGCLLRYPDAGLAEMLALRGLDLVVFDGEHGPLTPLACEHLARAVELHGVTPGVRVSENRAATIMRYLDAGALTCHLPGIESVAEAERAVRAVKFQPAGDRGLAASRASGYGAGGDYGSYVIGANRETQVVAHVESRAGVAAVSEIAAVDGVDVLLVGALDLSHDLGVPGELDHPEVVAASDLVAAAAGRSEKALGAMAVDAGDARRWIERGARYLLMTLESMLGPGVRSLIGEAREN
jgi:2-keto-3-deoxy-L-rhamnonate aldolase RhmA